MTDSREALVARMDAGWEELDLRLERLDASALERTTASGWTVGAMLSHLAAWQDATAYRLHRYALSGVAQPKVEEDDDAFNARVAAEAAAAPPDHVLSGLRASAGRLRDAVAALPGLDGEGWVAAVAAGNSYEHYEEHLAELDAVG